MRVPSMPLAVFVAAVGMSVAAAEAGDVYSSRGKGALANFNRLSLDGCQSEFISVSAAETVQRNPPDGPMYTAVAGISVFSADWCTYTFNSMWGTRTDPSFHIDTALRRATLNTVITACDNWNVCKDLAIDLVWTGTGDSGPMTTINHTPAFFSYFKSNARSAVMSGAVLDGDTNLVQGIEAWAQLTANAGHTLFR